MEPSEFSERPPRRNRRHWDVFVDGRLVDDLETFTKVTYGRVGDWERSRAAQHLLDDTRAFCDIPEALIAECRRELGLGNG